MGNLWVNFVKLSNQNDVFTVFKVFYRSQQSYVYESFPINQF